MSFSFAENQAFYVPVPANREEAFTIVNIFKPAFEIPIRSNWNKQSITTLSCC